MKASFGAKLLLAVIVLAMCGMAKRAPQPATNAEDLADQIDAFVNEKTKAATLAKARLVQKIAYYESQLKRNDPQGSRLVCEKIDKDLAALRERDELPSCDALLEIVLEHLSKHQNIVRSTEQFHERVETQLIRAQAPAAMKRLEELERRISKIIGGREYFVRGAIWKGRRQWAGKSVGIEFTVKEIAGNTFTARLVQHVAGTAKTRSYSITMDMTGTLDGNQLRMESASGKRALQFEGYLISRRFRYRRNER